MRFEQLYSLITEANDFSDLPDNLDLGYGFWAEPSGEYDFLRIGDHKSEAYDIVCREYDDEYERIRNELFNRNAGESNSEFFKRYDVAVQNGEIMHYQDFLLLKGFVRATIDDNTVYASGIHGRIAPKALKTAKDIAKFYNFEFDLGYIDPPKYMDKVPQ